MMKSYAVLCLIATLLVGSIALTATHAWSQTEGVTEDMFVRTALTTADRMANMTPQALLAAISLALTYAVIKLFKMIMDMMAKLVELQTKSGLNQENISAHMKDTNNLLRMIHDGQKDLQQLMTEKT